MKKYILLSLFTAGLIAAGLLLFTPQTASGSKPETAKAAGNEIPDSVLHILQISCMGCHSGAGSGFAKMKLNLSTWNEYEADKQVRKASSMCEELSEKGMPPKKWCINHPDSVPSQKQIEIICHWAKSLQK